MSLSTLAPQITALALQLAAVVLAALVSVLMARLGQVLPALIKDRQLRAYVETAVQAAQQTVPLKSERYATAARLVQQRFPAAPATQVQSCIEAAVAAFKLAQPGWDGLAPSAPVAPSESPPLAPVVDPARLAAAQAALQAAQDALAAATALPGQAPYGSAGVSAVVQP